MKVLAVSGYKPMEMGIFQLDDPKIVYVKEAIKRRLIPWIEDGLEWILISGQAGVECWTGEVILELKETYPIQLGVFPPFQNQEKRWPEGQQEKYLQLMEGADFFQPLYNKEYEGPYQFQAKDQWFLEKSDACLLLYDQETEGSPSFFLKKAQKYQQENHYPIFFITPFDLEETVQEMMLNDPNFWTN